MVEIVKNTTPGSYVEPGVVPNRSIRETTGFELVDGSKKREVEKSSKSLNINLFVYISSVVLAFFLFLPQVRGFFSDLGWRWAHILCLSFSLSFILNPVFARIAKKFSILDIPDA